MILVLKILFHVLIYILFICSSNSNVQPLVIAAHPHEANQFAVGLSDGGVHVFEPLESEGKWGVPPPNENGSSSNNVAVATSVGLSSDQAQRWNDKMNPFSAKRQVSFTYLACWSFWRTTFISTFVYAAGFYPN